MDELYKHKVQDYLTRSISDLNMCIPNPCKNGGQCLGYEGGHKCICLPGYKGESCEGEYLVHFRAVWLRLSIKCY